jgi:hypothetical protein
METTMRWIQRHRHNQRTKLPQISISQEEILADLLYPASRSPRRDTVAVRRVEAR